jgi:hypothetical protein
VPHLERELGRLEILVAGTGGAHGALGGLDVEGHLGVAAQVEIESKFCNRVSYYGLNC